MRGAVPQRQARQSRGSTFPTFTRRLPVVDATLRGIGGDFGPEHANNFRRDSNPYLCADYVLASPPKRKQNNADMDLPNLK